MLQLVRRWLQLVRRWLGRSGVEPAMPPPVERPPRGRQSVDPCREIDRIVRAVGETAQDHDDAAVRRLNAACEAMELLERRWEGSDQSAYPRLRREYVQELWRLVRELRRAGKYEEALTVWALARMTTDETHPEAVALAMQVARSFLERESLRRETNTVQQAFYLVIESMPAAVSVAPEFRAAIDGMFGAIQVDWRRPAKKESLGHQLRLIDGLRRLARHLPGDLADGLAFSAAIGRWRSQPSPDYDALKETFNDLLGRTRPARERRGIYWWCQTRVAYESSNGDRVGIVAGEVVGWRKLDLRLSHDDTPERLCHYFDALAEAEFTLRRRESNPRRASARPASQLQTVLHTQMPPVLQQNAELLRHVQPIVDAIGKLAQQPRTRTQQRR